MHFHAPFHPFQKHPMIPMAYVANLIMILLGIILVLLWGPVRPD